MTVLDTQAAATARARAPGLAHLFYGATLFLSAGLLFCVEPMFSKMVLPRLGGSSSVWSVAMVVFQGLLLLGYVYAHVLTRVCSLRQAALVHIGLMALATVSLPIAIAPLFAATPPQHFVSLWLIGLFVVSIGLPCFALSANAPLLQAWFARSGHVHSSNPYFLYRASNFGSFAVLLAYPFFIEPHLGLSAQSRLWTLFYAALLAGAGTCAFAASRWRDAEPTARPVARSVHVDAKTRLLWVTLGFIPSGLLVAVTAHIATDVASGPFLWILPLALYLLTFVLVFSERPSIPEQAMLLVQPASVAVVAVLLLWTAKMNWGVALIGHLFAFFVAAMVCHGRLYRLRPAAVDLTEFYALLSVGGMLGGIFAALLAPVFFSSVIEYPLLTFAALLARDDIWRAPAAEWKKEIAFIAAVVAIVAALVFVAGSPVAYFTAGAMALCGYLAVSAGHPARMIVISAVTLGAISLYDPGANIVREARSFYGVYKAVDVQHGSFRVLYHGTTGHGAERISHDSVGHAGTPEPLAYYSREGAYGEAIRKVRAHLGGRLENVALVGLGIGALTCHAAPDEHWTIYELDPLVVEIARDKSLFRSFSSCGAGDPVVIGDGRLTLESAKKPLDLLLLDIFSSDSVPTHMLTKEAFALFKSRLAPHGAIAFNISNHNMELARVVAASAAANDMVTAVKTDARPQAESLKLQAEIAVVAKSEADLTALSLGPGWRIVRPVPGVRVWTDDYSDVLGAIFRHMRE